MSEQPESTERTKGSTRGKIVGTTAVLMGAAGLFMYIVGVKRRHRLDEEREAALAPIRDGSRTWTDATARHPVDEDESDDEMDVEAHAAEEQREQA